MSNEALFSTVFEKREAMERELPEVAKEAVGYFVYEMIKLLSAISDNDRNASPWVLRRILALHNFNEKKFADRVSHWIAGRKYLPIIAVLDLGTASREFVAPPGSSVPETHDDDKKEWGKEGEDEDGGDDSGGDIDGWREEEKKAVATAEDYRDWLIEKTPELSVVYTEKEFLRWVRQMRGEAKEYFGGHLIDEETDEIWKRWDNILKKTEEGRPLSPEDRNGLILMLNIDIMQSRSKAADLLTSLILGEKYDTEDFIKDHQTIHKLRQFRANVEGREWPSGR